MTVTYLVGDCREMLSALPSESVHCVVTSPPYFGLRDYQTAAWEGGDPACDHKKPSRQGEATTHSAPSVANDGVIDFYRDTCQKCGAVRVDRQIGMEASISAYVSDLASVFREVRRILRNDGTLWLNLGDSYSSGSRRTQAVPTLRTGGHDAASGKQAHLNGLAVRPPCDPAIGPKQLMGIPWRVAFALQEDGWILRSEITWAKKSPMPESVRDRPTSATEKVFLFAKRQRYFYDNEAVRESSSRGSAGSTFTRGKTVVNGQGRVSDKPRTESTSRNMRNFWLLGPSPFPKAHFATFPPALVEPCIKAGTSERGCCPSCGAPLVRVLERTPMEIRRSARGDALGDYGRTQSSGTMVAPATAKTVGWKPSCACDAGDPVPCTILDPFGGAGTTAMVAERLGRGSIYIDLNPDYAEMARDRLAEDASRTHGKGSPRRKKSQNGHTATMDFLPGFEGNQ